MENKALITNFKGQEFCTHSPINLHFIRVGMSSVYINWGVPAKHERRTYTLQTK